MCMFCAAVPAALSVGAALQGQQRQKRKAADARGEVYRAPMLPPSKLTGAAVSVLVVAAVVYHTHQPV